MARPAETGLLEHAARFRVVARRILEAAEEGRPRDVFVARTLRLLLEDAGASLVLLRVREEAEEVERSVRAKAARMELRRSPAPPEIVESDPPEWLESFDPGGEVTTRLGSVFVGEDWLTRIAHTPDREKPPHLRGLDAGAGAASAAWVPLVVRTDPRAALVLERADGAPFDRAAARLYEALAQILVVALDQQNARWALGERVKELTCLYEIARVVADRDAPLGKALERIAAALPPAFQYPEVASARIVVDGASHTSPGFRPGPHVLTTPVFALGAARGAVEVGYARIPDPGVEPFLREERALLAAVAAETGGLLERAHAEAEKTRLETQLRHADRLVTIGHLAAGVAHELNEPLGSILGFAQLAGKIEPLPAAVAQDLEKIVRAALHAREIVRKLVLFARHEPPRKAPARLNTVVADALDLLAARCERAGVAVERRLDPALPEIVADAGQLRQVVVNLAVNAVQAMRAGGTLTVTTSPAPEGVTLEVRDDGAGMDAATREKIFTPFFTTKDVGEGTGLGLAVVHGIVASHGGTIEVESAPGEGSRFVVRLPLGVPDFAHGEQAP